MRRGAPRRPRGARAIALAALEALESGRIQRLKDPLDAARLPPRDHALAQELAYGAERQRLFLDAVLAPLTARGLPDAPRARCALRLGAYQLLFLARIPAHAALHETVDLLGHERGFANAVLRRLAGMVHLRAADPALPRLEVALPPGEGGATRCVRLDPPGLPDPAADPAAYLAARYALPQVLVARWFQVHGAATERIAAASAAVPEVILRARPAQRDALRAELAEVGVETVAGDHPLCLRWTGGGSPFGTEAFREGRFVVQDPTAVRAAEAVEAQPGETILDLCAAPGTKTTLLAEQVGPKGHVFAWDPEPRRRARISANAARAGLGGVIAVVEDLARVPACARALVDVPCSNSGVLARRVEARRRLERPDPFAALLPLQRRLLRDALARVKSEGRVVYSTCSLEPEENGEAVRAVLADLPPGTVEVLQECLILPDTPEHDGGYHAVLRVGKVPPPLP
ncbi:MAG: hypothetical protein IT458_09315 [Planctomycetes bacterium]|nr:hypothetical protein [Planctomycetota bacterium]